MAIIQTFSHPEVRVFRSSVCSKATFFSLFSFLLILVPPFFVAFASRTFWLKEDSYREIPRARFSHKAIVVLRSWRDDAEEAADYRIFSTFENYNILHRDKFVPATIDVPPSSSSSSSSSAVDVKISLFPGDDFRVRSVTALLFFRFDLSAYTRLSMEGMAFLQRSATTTPAPSSLWFDGEMRLKQNSPLPHRGLDDRFDSSVVDEAGISLQDFALKKIVRDYKDRDVRLELETVDHLWSGVSDGGGDEEKGSSEFVIEARFRFPEERVVYRPGIAQMLKWAWIQYLSVLIIFYFVVERIKAFVFLNQIIPTIVETRLEKIRGN